MTPDAILLSIIMKRKQIKENNFHNVFIFLIKKTITEDIFIDILLYFSSSDRHKEICVGKIRLNLSMHYSCTFSQVCIHVHQKWVSGFTGWVYKFQSTIHTTVFLQFKSIAGYSFNKCLILQYVDTNFSGGHIQEYK